MTNLEKFKTNYPNAPLKPNGLPEQIRCPYQLGLPFKDKCVSPDDCPGCWGMEEYAEEEEKQHSKLCMRLNPNCICNTCVNDSETCCISHFIRGETCKGATDCPDYIKEETK